jgi:hypothetical protein
LPAKDIGLISRRMSRRAWRRRVSRGILTFAGSTGAGRADTENAAMTKAR